MNSSKFYQKTSFKIILSVLLFLVFAAALSAALYLPYLKPYQTDNQCSIVFVGASTFTRGIDPKKVDEQTGTRSYVLATVDAPLFGRYEMLKSALENETIDTVVIEVSQKTLTKQIEKYDRDDRVLFFPKILGLKNKADALGTYYSFWEDEYDYLYADLLYEGALVWLRYIARADYGKYLANRGFSPYDADDQALNDAEDMETTFNANNLRTEYEPVSVDYLERMIQMSLDSGRQVILVTMPGSQKFVWQSVGLDEYRDAMAEIADRNGIPYYDFNLLEDIGSYLDDRTSFHDREHLSEDGAYAFSSIIGEVIHSYCTNTPSRYHFYESYEEAKEHSVYQAR